MELFDSHAHYNDEKFDEDREEVINAIYKSGVTKLINAGYSLESSIYALQIAKKYSWMYTISGISPNDIPDSKVVLEKELNALEELINREMFLEESNKNCKDNILSKDNVLSDKIELKEKKQQKIKKIVAIGEIGLDYYWEKDLSQRELQKQAFIKQIELANKYNLPIVIHTREAVMDTLEILKEHQVIKRGVFHCCPLNRELVKEALKSGYYISFAGPITFKNSKNANEIIELVPLEKMLIETDSPYLSPEPNRGKRNDSRNVKYMAEKIATVRQIPVDEIAKITYENACRVFEIEQQVR